MKNKPHLWTVAATILFAILAYFGYSPDLATAGSLADAADQAADALSVRNWILGFNGLVAVGALIYDFIRSGSLIKLG